MAEERSSISEVPIPKIASATTFPTISESKQKIHGSSSKPGLSASKTELSSPSQEFLLGAIKTPIPTAEDGITVDTEIPSEISTSRKALREEDTAEAHVSFSDSFDVDEISETSIIDGFDNEGEEEEEEEEGQAGLEEQSELVEIFREGEDSTLADEELVYELEPEKKINYQEILDAPRDLPPPKELTIENLKSIEKELGLIKLCWPRIEDASFENRTQFPHSYLENSNKEKLLLLYTENFRRQFWHRFHERKQILLACENECGMQKMVCTTLRPTKLAHPEIETWKDCAKFVGEQIRYIPFEIQTVIPSRLCSPHTVFLRQSGQSYELATALCSLLLGLGYDAYVVSGYATRDITMRIMTRVDSPYPPDEEEVEEEVAPPPPNKYTLKPPRDLRSKFLMMMEQRELDKINDRKAKQKEAEAQRVAEEEEPPPDDLYARRVHAWVLIRPSRDVVQNIFVEPSTGHDHPTDSPLYTGVESVWNNVNYWVNMQKYSDGDLAAIDYDLTKVKNWEHLLIGEPISARENATSVDMDEEEFNAMVIMQEKHLDMPPPWSLKITIPHHVLQAKYPGGKSKTTYKRTVVLEYAPYLLSDGLVRKIYRYEDFNCTDLLKYEEAYENRLDKLIKRVLDKSKDSVTEYFDKGREDCVIKHYFSRGNKLIQFEAKYRSDSLLKIQIEPYVMTEIYEGREDFLTKRQSNYIEKEVPAEQKGPPGQLKQQASEFKKQIFKIAEHFARNEELAASSDVAVREFRLTDREIHLKYHYGKNKVTASTRVFIKPALTDVNKEMNFTPEMTYGYQAELGAKPEQHFKLLRLLMELIKAEENSLSRVRQVEDQITEFLELRLQETAMPKLEVTIFNREQNEQYRIAMLEKEKEIMEHKEKEVEEDVDYLAPYLAWIGNPTYLTEKEERKVKAECLQDFRMLLLDRALALQKTFEKTSEMVQDKYKWFSVQQDHLDPEEELEYFKEVSELNFKLQTLELRLHRHKELSSERYTAMVEYLENHPKLNPENLTD